MCSELLFVPLLSWDRTSNLESEHEPTVTPTLPHLLPFGLTPFLPFPLATSLLYKQLLERSLPWEALNSTAIAPSSGSPGPCKGIFHMGPDPVTLFFLACVSLTPHFTSS